MTSDARGSGVLRLLTWLHRVEDALLALLLGSIVVLAPLQILLRNLFDAGLIWADPFLRLLVLWVALFGALAASRQDKQIGIDVVSKFLPARSRAFVGLLTNLFTCAVCGVVALHAWEFVEGERAYGAIAFSGIPAWLCESVIPFAFAMIGIRHLGHAVRHGRNAAGWPVADETEAGRME